MFSHSFDSENYTYDGDKFTVFVDRDGTIIKNIPYLKKTSEIIFFYDIIFALRKVSDRINIIVITNQSGIGRKLLSQQDLFKVHSIINSFYLHFGLKIIDFIYCPHLPEDNCECRKPKSGMLNFAMQKYNINIKHALMIGDSKSDQEAAELARIEFYSVDQKRKHDEEIENFIASRIY